MVTCWAVLKNVILKVKLLRLLFGQLFKNLDYFSPIYCHTGCVEPTLDKFPPCSDASYSAKVWLVSNRRSDSNGLQRIIVGKMMRVFRFRWIGTSKELGTIKQTKTFLTKMLPPLTKILSKCCHLWQKFYQNFDTQDEVLFINQGRTSWMYANELISVSTVTSLES